MNKYFWVKKDIASPWRLALETETGRLHIHTHAYGCESYMCHKVVPATSLEPPKDPIKVTIELSEQEVEMVHTRGSIVLADHTVLIIYNKVAEALLKLPKS